MANVSIDLSNLPKVINRHFYKLLFDQNRYLVLKGGGGSGKSKFCAQKLIYRMLAEKGHRFLVVRKVGDTLRDSVFADLKKVISEWDFDSLFHVPDGRSSELYIKCKLNGNEILFYGLDRVEKRKSVEGITGIWIEEASELLEGDLRQLDIRIRGKSAYAQMMLSFNPINVNHWLKKEFFDAPKVDATIHESTYKNNPYLDMGTIKTLEGYRITDPYYYMVYCLNEWGTLGRTIFPAQIVSERLSYVRNRSPLKQGFFAFEADSSMMPKVDSITWVDDESGHIRIYEEPTKAPYVLGGDTAGEGSDFFTAHVINNTTGVQCAVLHQQFDEIEYAQQCYCLAVKYNNALVGLEVNFSTYPTRKFEEWSYSRLYVRETQDSFTHSLQKRYGFMTTKFTRPLIIAELVTLVRESASMINDVKTLEEMLTFVRNESGRAEAQEGAHDDLLMGLAITYHIRTQQAYSTTSTTRVDLSKLPEDYQEDYYNASENDRKYLLEKWGMA